jgi:hypothetical protein
MDLVQRPNNYDLVQERLESMWNREQIEQADYRRLQENR